MPGPASFFCGTFFGMGISHKVTPEMAPECYETTDFLDFLDILCSVPDVRLTPRQFFCGTGQFLLQTLAKTQNPASSTLK